MGEAASEVRREIEERRDDLGENLQRLESKVKRTTDWRAQFDQRPMMMMGVAFGGGLLLSTLAGGGNDRDQREQQRSGDREMMHSSPPSRERNEISETIDNIRGALMGLAARELRSFMATAVPGFEQEYRETTNRRDASPSTRLDESEQMPSTAAMS
jgi:predicted dienelactone hydrolase